ncbi:hypothetical protein L873DRAFT_1795729 [Choiromyces venosus 120613-1]|uniref:Uncharacterized protein n=1 Tax=Choiromyces venosus 120613-1 TaxID=1336337 RepID=A0A3N4J0H3_9PEZI|nr:hypothetical protein L873DRAFT_1795729 [Choiromyces venosus 120613-1]
MLEATEKLEIKEQLDQAMEWLAEEPITQSKEDLERFFVEYENTLIKCGIKCAKYIANIDESGVCIRCPTGKIVIVPTQVKELYTTSPENQKSITIIETICTDGSPPLPPIVRYPGEKIKEG